MIRYGTRLIFHGRLTDGSGGVSGERVYLEGGDLLGIREWPRRTGADGRWSVTLSRQIVRRMTWRAVFLGSQTRARPPPVGTPCSSSRRSRLPPDRPTVGR